MYQQGRSWVGADAAWQFPLKRENHRGIFNANLGAHLPVTRRVDVGMGVFTDNDSQNRFDGTLTKPGNRFGAVVGIQFRSAELVEELKESGTGDGKNRRRVLATTLALSYSIQQIEYQQIHFLADSSTLNYEVNLESDRAVIHQLALHPGGGFYFLVVDASHLCLSSPPPVYSPEPFRINLYSFSVQYVLMLFSAGLGVFIRANEIKVALGPGVLFPVS